MTAVLKQDDGFSLIEMLIVVAILGIIMTGLQQVIATAVTSYNSTKDKQDMENHARFAMERMVRFVQETDLINLPDSATDQEKLEISERLLDTYNNDTQAYALDGDGWLDADNDKDGIINEDTTTPDPQDIITFGLDKTDAGNWKLLEEMPDYSTTPGGHLATRELCEHVTEFKNNLVRKNDLEFHNNLVEIQLTLDDGTNNVSLKTRARARLME
jgi:prepilin-type N-terminal cleavage/methylation domain-containing protein